MQRRAAVIKNLPETGRHKQIVDQPGQLMLRKQIVNEIVYFNATFNLAKTVLMVPETIWTETLLINKEIRALHVSNFSCPVDGNP